MILVVSIAYNLEYFHNMINNKNISKFFFLFLFSHLVLWTLIPFLSNVNLPLDTIEALAWGSKLDWGFQKHPPLSAVAAQFFYLIFGSNDFAYYFLSQLFVIISFIFVFKFSLEILKDKTLAFLSLLVLESIYFYNFTSPEFNVNVSQLPFWALTVFYFWKSVKENKLINWVLFGIVSALGFLSKYLFIYILFALFLFIIIDFKTNKKFVINYFLSIVVSLTILAPHFIWLYQNEFVTILYALERSSLIEVGFFNHLINPVKFLIKQFFILIPFFLMFVLILKKYQFKIKLNNENTLFLLSISVVPFVLMLLTSIITGANIRTMWMTPFYLFLGTLFFHILRKNIDLKRIKKFYILFFFFFFISPSLYLAVSVLDKTKRTDYPGKEISRLVQNKWDDNFTNDIKIVIGDEWFAGNLSYHLSSRPIWMSEFKDKNIKIKDDQGVIYTGNPKILKRVCPGVFGTIKPVGYCMIGRR